MVKVRTTVEPPEPMRGLEIPEQVFPAAPGSSTSNDVRRRQPRSSFMWRGAIVVDRLTAWDEFCRQSCQRDVLCCGCDPESHRPQLGRRVPLGGCCPTPELSNTLPLLTHRRFTDPPAVPPSGSQLAQVEPDSLVVGTFGTDAVALMHWLRGRTS
jgi:hypothetical protein